MKNIVFILDKMVQEKASNYKSEISRKPADCFHHIIGRANQLLRWDKQNLFACTLEEHDLIHRGILKIDSFVSPKRMGYLINKRVESLTFKPDDEFYEKQKKNIKETL